MTARYWAVTGGSGFCRHETGLVRFLGRSWLPIAISPYGHQSEALAEGREVVNIDPCPHYQRTSVYRGIEPKYYRQEKHINYLKY
jgi:hypothetical protein